MNVAKHARSFCNRLRTQQRTAPAAASVLAVAAGMLLAAPASANVSHTFTNSFGSASSTPANPYPLSGPTDVDVDQASHDIYVTDPGHSRVEKFDSSGNFLFMFGAGVDKSTGGNVCTAASGDICQAGTSASSSGAFETPAYLAVDNSGGPSNGDIYVADTGDNLVQKFDSSGNLIKSWGAAGQKDGSDATDLPVFGPLFGVAVGGPNGDLYVAGQHYSNNVWQYSQDGTYEGPYQNENGNLAPFLKADPAGNLYFPGPAFTFGPTVVTQAVLRSGSHGVYDYYPMGTVTPVAGFGLDPFTRELYQNDGSVVDHYSTDCNPPVAPCDPVDSFGSGHLFGSMGVGVDGASHTVYVANSTSNNIAAFGDVRPIVTTGSPTSVTESSVTVTGHIDPAGRGDITSCHFEYGFDKSYGTTLPCTPDPASSNFTGPTDVTATITGLSPGTRDHYRVVATNAAGATSDGADQTFITTQPPAIDGLASANLTATSADLNAQVNPNGLDTTYRFEYGPTTAYGQSAPVPDGTISASNSDQAIGVHLDNLVPHIVYHYRLVAKNDDGTTTAEDHTFNFYPPSCPNENVRQQTQANYLPDCRAYELVSPGDAGGTQLYPGGPNTGYATNPSRFSYTGLWSTIPNSGGSPIDGTGDLYVATRTDTGWVTKYVGPPANQVVVAGGPPQGLWGQGGPQFLGNNTSESSAGFGADIIQNNVLTNPSMDTFLDWNDGRQYDDNLTPIASNAPYVWSADGRQLDRWPTNLGTVPDGIYPAGSNIWPSGNYVSPGAPPLTTAPGGAHALDCPAVGNAGSGLNKNDCPGDVSASSDLSHFVFSTEWNVFAPGGQLSAPGSVYDNNIAAGAVVVASKTPAGDDIPSEPTDQAGDPLQIPAVSSDGSHILIAAGGTGPCGLANCPTPPCGGTFGGKIHCPSYPSHLYMRVDGALTYDVSQGHDVTYVGMTADGSKVYFTTAQRLTPDDTDASTDLYMWSEATNSLTLVSKGSNGAGNSDACNTSFTPPLASSAPAPTGCGVVTYSNLAYCQLSSGVGGNCRSDNSIASQNGDIYFFSPEQLDGSRGLHNQENLYDYRGGQVQYVATLKTGPFCFQSPVPGISDSACSDTPVARMQVSPDGSHMAFATASPITQYDNAGHLEMYTYDPSTGKVVCASCIPSGAPPTSDIGASQDGLFMANDGRAFFTTNDALVHSDTNQGLDVYEYVDGRPQLITPGTGETSQAGGFASAILNTPGLSGVSADGRDVYFSTYDTLVPQDHNGLFLKMYDARAGGGFPAPASPPPCNAADECHGAGSSPSNAPSIVSKGDLGTGGNVAPTINHHRHRKRQRRAHKHHHARAAHANRRAGA